MARDRGLEALVEIDLGSVPGIEVKPMFGGLCWLWRGNLLCCAHAEGILYRLGKGNDGWALALDEVTAMTMGGRRMHGWVRLDAASAADDGLRRRLIDAATAFVASLPPK